MLRRTYHGQMCTVAKTLEIVGERWTLLIVRDALRGVTRFNEFRAGLGIVASVLADRLERLTQAGILIRVPYHERPPRYDYRLTPKGRELATVVMSLMRWGDLHLAGESGPPLSVRHLECGGQTDPVLVCRACGQTTTPDEIVPVPAAQRAAPGLLTTT